jgi:HK97 family phage prohead protease
MQVEVRNDSVFISGYVNAVERLSKPIRETLHGRIMTFLERIKAGVFRNALKKNDNVLVLLNHDNNRVLASTKDGNAVLEEDNIGLRAEITITDKEVVQKARDGKLSGWSFGFIANDDELSTEGKDEIRTVTDLELLEVSILDDTKAPAYYGTSIEAREGGAKVVEIRADAFEQTAEPNAEQTEQPTISIDELAELVAAKVIEALKTEEKAEETEAETQEEAETEEQTEEQAETEETEEADTEEQTEETTEEQAQDAEAEEETEEQESRSIDYSAFETRLANLTK